MRGATTQNNRPFRHPRRVLISRIAFVREKYYYFKAPNKSINIKYDPEGKDMPCILKKQQLVEQYKFYFRSLAISKPSNWGRGNMAV